MIVEKTITMDMENNSVPLYLNSQSFENKSRKLFISLSYNKMPLDLSAYNEIKLHCDTGKSTAVITSGISVQNNTIIFCPQSDFTSLEGKIHCKFILKGNSETLCSPIFMISNQNGLKEVMTEK